MNNIVPHSIKRGSQRLVTEIAQCELQTSLGFNTRFSNGNRAFAWLITYKSQIFYVLISASQVLTHRPHYDREHCRCSNHWLFWIGGKNRAGKSHDYRDAMIFTLRRHLYGLGYPRQPSPQSTLAEVTISLFLSKIQPAVYIKIANSGSHRGRVV